MIGININLEQYFQQFPSIDMLINAAGIGNINAMDTLDEVVFLRTLNANLVTPFLLGGVDSPFWDTIDLK